MASTSSRFPKHGSATDWVYEAHELKHLTHHRENSPHESGSAMSQATKIVLGTIIISVLVALGVIVALALM